MTIVAIRVGPKEALYCAPADMAENEILAEAADDFADVDWFLVRREPCVVEPDKKTHWWLAPVSAVEDVGSNS